jgi:transposase
LSHKADLHQNDKIKNHLRPELQAEGCEFADARGNAREVAEELGIPANLIYRWRREALQFGTGSFPDHGCAKMTAQELENAKLHHELKDVTMERAILKTAIRISSETNRKKSRLQRPTVTYFRLRGCEVLGMSASSYYDSITRLCPPEARPTPKSRPASAPATRSQRSAIMALRA